MVSHSAVKVLELQRKINMLNNEVEAKSLKLQSMTGSVAETAILWKKNNQLRELPTKGEANGAGFGGSQKLALVA